MARDQLPIEAESTCTGHDAGAGSLDQASQVRLARAACTACVGELRGAGVQPEVASAIMIQHGIQMALGFGSVARVVQQMRRFADAVEALGVLKPPGGTVN